MHHTHCHPILNIVSAGRTLLTVLFFVGWLSFAGVAMFFTGCTFKQDTAADVNGQPPRSAGELSLYGKTIDGEDFDWESLRGKYVLVKFTATWCGPCKREIPGMLAAYEKYRGKDFEIVSVYIWKRDGNADIQQSVEQEKLPWLIISESLTEKAGMPPQGRFFGIEGVPTMLLVDKEGKILTPEARGAKLKQELQRLFGE